MKKILIIEDDKDMNNLLTEILRSYGFNVINSFDALDALDKLKENSIDLILLDYQMPKMNGLQFLEKIRENRTPTRAIMISAHGSRIIKEKADELGVIQFLDKPFELEELVEVVESNLK
jgi:DNA-binding response OmpR family regulator